MHALSRTALLAIALGVGGIGGFVGGLVDDRLRKPWVPRPRGNPQRLIGLSAGADACAPRGVRVKV